MSHDHEHNSDVHVPHVAPLKMYFGVAAGLMILTIVTVVTAKSGDIIGFKPGQPWDIIIALIIAMTKASLVALFFMHLLYETPFMRLTFVSSLFFLSFFFIFTLTDTLTREESAKPKEVIKVKAMKGYSVKGYKLDKDGKEIKHH